MNRQTLIILGGGFCAALMVALLMQAMLGGNSKPEILNEEPKVEVLIYSGCIRCRGGTTRRANSIRKHPRCCG